jgi:hypothetical protein
MCTFTPTLFPNCRCPSITTGALSLCASATRTGEKCSQPTREPLQKHPGTCGPCKQAQVAREKAKAEAENARARVGREDSFVVDEPAVSKEEGTGVELAKSTSRTGRGGKGKKKSGSGNTKAVGESKRVTRSGAKTVLPSR